ncbi:HXXEE domain-containing protein [Rhizobium sp. TRM96647]|uniref:HXXEE domain-containing protein n=1 Tax=unclassified Rhizobium TaxID=2613769 RepID=UPI0021E73328|nr:MULTISPECIES: HXXEE domain-containing protein [unclassified Rhizobium]MCV3736714.1 HXXEE domain-containing protein [Rhizobium sp. TRM96647]MCV3756886.1 HXXEE domain-containing protein [Rhizobium sp. TRM96650]
MSLQDLAWLAMAAYAIHIMEEHTFDWRNWARGVIGLPVEWTDFYVTNAVVIAVGIAQAQLAPTVPLIPLIFAALMLINTVFFHILPVIRTKGRFSPGARDRSGAVFAARDGDLHEGGGGGASRFRDGPLGLLRRGAADGLSGGDAAPEGESLFPAGRKMTVTSSFSLHGAFR